MSKSSFFQACKTSVEDLGEGISRQILGHDETLMMVKVFFGQGAIGKVHHHAHHQTSYVVSGVFDVTIGKNTQILKAGDAFFTSPDEVHGVICLEEGTLIDVFAPAREDFLE
jgi:quercetin dioxygenase-like cupin family protein